MSSLKSFKAALEEEYSFPTEYVFKFIIKSSSKQDVFDLLPDAVVKEKKSSKGKYVAITLTQFVKNSSEIVYIYEKASKIKGVISL